MADTPSPELFTEVAHIREGRDITRGFIPAGPMEPQDSILRNRGFFNLDIYRDVRRDDQVISTFQQRRLAMISREYYVEAGGEKRIDKRAADFIRENLAQVRWDRINNHMLWGIFYGFAVGECMWDLRSSQVWLADVKVRARERFRWDRDGNLLLLTVQEPNGVIMPERKFWTFSTGDDNDDEPYGLGLAHWLYWPVFFKRHGVKFWLTFLDKFGSPTPVGKFNPGAGDKDRRRLLEAVVAIQRDAGIIIPEGMVIELLEAKRSGTPDHTTLVNKMDAAISKVVLSQTMTTDDGSSLAQGEVHAEVKDEVVKADSDLMCGSFNDGPVKWLVDWNFPGAAYPRVWRRVESEPDLKPIAERDRIIYEMGFDPSEEYIKETYGEGWTRRAALPRPEPEAPSVDGSEGEAVFTEACPSCGQRHLAFAEDDKVTDSLTDLVERVLPDDAWEPLIGPSIEPLRKLAEDSTDLAEFRDRLGDVLGDQDIEKLNDALAQALFQARLAGETGAQTSDDDPSS